MVQTLNSINTKNVFAKYNLVGLKKKIYEINSKSHLQVDENFELLSDFSRTKPRPEIELLKKEENEVFEQERNLLAQQEDLLQLQEQDFLRVQEQNLLVRCQKR